MGALCGAFLGRNPRSPTTASWQQWINAAVRCARHSTARCWRWRSSLSTKTALRRAQTLDELRAVSLWLTVRQGAPGEGRIVDFHRCGSFTPIGRDAAAHGPLLYSPARLQRLGVGMSPSRPWQHHRRARVSPLRCPEFCWHDSNKTVFFYIGFFVKSGVIFS